MRAIRLIAQREWLATILSPTGLIVVVLYLVVSGYLFWLNVSVTQEATLRYTFSSLGAITAFVVPLITMRLLSEELRAGTFEVLTSHPVRDTEIVFGKFLAGYLAFLALSLPTLSYVLILEFLGSPDWGPALSAYLGQQLLAVMLLALGLLTSALTANQILAAMAAMIGGILLWLAGTASAAGAGRLSRALSYLAMFEHFSLFRRGVLDTRALVYFLATAAMFLYRAVRAIESRRWKFGTLPGLVSASWRWPRLSVVLLVASSLILTQALLSSIARKMWIPADVGMIALGVGILATPVYLNRVRLRSELARRRMGIPLTVASNCLLVLIIWALATFLASQRYLRLDLTSSKHYQLSDQTRTVLDGLKSPVEVAVVMEVPTDLRQEVRDLLDEYRANCSKLAVREIDPVRNPGELDQLRRRFKLTTLPSNEVIIAAGDQVRRIPVVAMLRRKLVVADNRAVGATAQFVGEAELTAALIQLGRKVPGRIAFLSGHAERNSDDSGNEGASLVAAELRRNGWVVETHVVAPGKNAALADDTSVVVLAGPQKAVADEDIAALRGVLDRGGGMLVLMDPGVKTGLEALLADWNIRVADNIVIDLQNQLASGDATSLYVTRFSQDHPIGKGMGSLAAVLPTARRVAVAHDQVRTDVSTSNFVHASGQSWAVGYQAGAAPQFVRGRDRQGPISLGMACERFREFPEPGHAPLAGRLVVIGDSDFITDRYVDMAGNMNLFLNAVDWLAGRQDLISVRPKVADVRMLDLTARQSQVVFWLSVVVVPGGTVLAGVSAMVRRRRRA